jgi:predicted transcriptional regulator
MADGGLTLNIDQALAEKLRNAARSVGESVEVYARQALEAFSGAEEGDWDEAIRRLEEFDRTGESVSADEAFAAVRANLKKRYQLR